MENPNVKTAIVEAGEFPELIDRYQIDGVPKTVVNERNSILGAVPEQVFVEQALEGLT